MAKIIDVGRVSAVYPASGTAKVVFDDRDNYVTPELPIMNRGSQGVKDYWMPAVGEQVICAFLSNTSKEGFILGSHFNDEDKPPVTSKNKQHLRFPDGTFIEYDQQTHILTVDVKGMLILNTTGDVTVTGDVVADGVSLKNHTHSHGDTAGTTSGPSGGG